MLQLYSCCNLSKRIDLGMPYKNKSVDFGVYLGFEGSLHWRVDQGWNSQIFFQIGGIGTIVPGLFVNLRQGLYYEIGDEQ